jgi:hypothetical protein
MVAYRLVDLIGRAPPACDRTQRSVCPAAPAGFWRSPPRTPPVLPSDHLLRRGQAAEPAKMFHVGMVNLILPRSAPFNVAFEQRLRELGYVEGQNLAIDFLGLDGHVERLPEAMEELVRRKSM